MGTAFISRFPEKMRKICRMEVLNSRIFCGMLRVDRKLIKATASQTNKHHKDSAFFLDKIGDNF